MVFIQSKPFETVFQTCQGSQIGTEQGDSSHAGGLLFMRLKGNPAIRSSGFIKKQGISFQEAPLVRGALKLKYVVIVDSCAYCLARAFHTFRPAPTRHHKTPQDTTRHETDDGEHMTELPSLDKLDASCHALWRSGAVGDCRQQALHLIERAVADDDVLAQACGWLHRARCDQFQSIHLDMLESARRAMALLHAGESDHHLVQARVLACAAATALNRHDEAIEAGLLARHLAEASGHAEDRLLAAETLAMAFGWADQVEAALDCFDHALAEVQAISAPGGGRGRGGGAPRPPPRSC
jgi:hypothetical protein